jgi:hypothetical protein
LIFALAFDYLLRKSRCDSLIKIFSALIADIDKILKPKVLIDPRKKLSAEYYNYLNIFNRTLAKRLSLSRFNVDYKIILKKTPDGKDLKVS